MQLVLRSLNSARKDVEKEFSEAFANVQNDLAASGSEMRIPRRCERQTLRNNVEAGDPEEYYKRAVFIPFLDSIIQQMSDRFPQITIHATRTLYLVPLICTE